MEISRGDVLLLKNADGSLGLQTVHDTEKPMDPHQVFAAPGPDSTINLYMIFTDGPNKGKIFLVMPLNDKVSQDDINAAQKDAINIDEINSKLGLTSPQTSSTPSSSTPPSTSSSSSSSSSSLLSSSSSSIASPSCTLSIVNLNQAPGTADSKQKQKPFSETAINEVENESNAIGNNCVISVAEADSTTSIDPLFESKDDSTPSVSNLPGVAKKSKDIASESEGLEPFNQNVRPVWCIQSSVAREMWQRKGLGGGDGVNSKESVVVKESEEANNVSNNKPKHRPIAPRIKPSPPANEEKSKPVAKDSVKTKIVQKIVCNFKNVLPKVTSDVTSPSTKLTPTVTSPKTCAMTTGGTSSTISSQGKQSVPRVGPQTPILTLSSDGSGVVSLLGASGKLVASKNIANQSPVISPNTTPNTVPTMALAKSPTTNVPTPQLSMPSVSKKNTIFLLPQGTQVNPNSVSNMHAQPSSQLPVFFCGATMSQNKNSATKPIYLMDSNAFKRLQNNNLAVSSVGPAKRPAETVKYSNPATLSTQVSQTFGKSLLAQPTAPNSKLTMHTVSPPRQEKDKSMQLKNVVVVHAKKKDSGDMNLKSVFQETNESAVKIPMSQPPVLPPESMVHVDFTEPPESSDSSESTLKIDRVFSLNSQGDLEESSGADVESAVREDSVLKVNCKKELDEQNVIDRATTNKVLKSKKDGLTKKRPKKFVEHNYSMKVEFSPAFNRVSNFENVILPDNAIADFQLFSASYVVLEKMGISGGKLTGIAGHCSQTCRQNAVRKGTETVMLGPRVKKRKVKIGPKCAKFRKRKESEKVKIIGRPYLGFDSLSLASDSAPARTPVGADTCITVRRLPPSSKVLKIETPQSSNLATKSVMTTPGLTYRCFTIDNKTVLFPCHNPGQSPSGILLNNAKPAFSLLSKSPPVSIIKQASSACSAAKPCTTISIAPLPSTTTVQSISKVIPSAIKQKKNPNDDGPPDLGPPIDLHVKKEPETSGYGDESQSQTPPPLKIKDEKLNRGYSDEVPVGKKSKRSPDKNLDDTVSSESSKMPKLEKMEPVLSRRERIESLKKLLKEQEMAVEERRRERLASDSTAVV